MVSNEQREKEGSCGDSTDALPKKPKKLDAQTSARARVVLKRLVSSQSSFIIVVVRRFGATSHRPRHVRRW
jgi:hypothetical protein